MELTVSDIVAHATSFEDGALVSDALISAADADGFVVVSFSGIDTITTSFLNGLFVRTLRLRGRDFLFAKTRFTHLSRQVRDMIQTRFISKLDDFEAAS